MSNKIDLMIDSGAFSAWSVGEEVDLDAYCKFLHKFRDCYSACVTLDVIPKAATPHAMRAAYEQGLKNLKRMRSEKLNPMPVYHFGEPIAWLLKYIDDGFDYVGIGGTVQKSGDARRRWFDEIFATMSRRSLWPQAKLHGFGMTSPPLMYRYPWHSVDSITWARVAGFGCVYIPPKRDGAYDYDTAPHVVSMSNRFGATDAQTEYHAMGDAGKAAVKEWLTGRGYKMRDIIDSYMWRRRACVNYFKLVEKRHAPQPFTTRARGLFDAKPVHDSTGYDPGRLRIIFTMGECLDVYETFEPEGVQRVLLAYPVYEKIKERIDLRDYVRTGKLPNYDGRVVRRGGKVQ